jgi:hypothetical protein
VNDDYEVDDKNAQMMCSIKIYNNKVSAFNPREKKSFISYFKTNYMILLKKM